MIRAARTILVAFPAATIAALLALHFLKG